MASTSPVRNHWRRARDIESSTFPSNPTRPNIHLCFPCCWRRYGGSAPEFPGNIPWFQGIVILAGVAFLALSHQMMNRVFKFEPRVSLLLLAILVLNPTLLSASQWILSEIPYAAVSTAALLYYETACRRGGPVPGHRLFLLAALSGAGYLLKAHGIVLPMALAGCILFERKWRDLTIYLASLSLFLVPWLVWVGQAGKVGGYSPLTQYYVGYQSTLSSAHSFEHWAMIVGQNAKYLANTLDHFLLALVPLLADRQPGSGRTPDLWTWLGRNLETFLACGSVICSPVSVCPAPASVAPLSSSHSDTSPVPCRRHAGAAPGQGVGLIASESFDALAAPVATASALAPDCRCIRSPLRSNSHRI